MMKRSHKIAMGTMLMALTGYGAWTLYKKYNQDFMKEMECAYQKISKDVEKSLDDMM